MVRALGVDSPGHTLAVATHPASQVDEGVGGAESATMLGYFVSLRREVLRLRARRCRLRPELVEAWGHLWGTPRATPPGKISDH